MNPILLAGAALFGGAVIYFVLQPLLAGRRAPMGATDEEMTEAEAKRRVTLLALRDVEYDHATGKLDERDYRELKRELSAEAIEALGRERDERNRREADKSGVIDLEAEIRRVRQGLRAGNTCRSCGHVNPGGSRFCSACGGRLVGASGGGAAG